MTPAHSRIIGGRIVPKPRSSGQAAAVLRFPGFIARIAATMHRKRSADAADKYLARELKKYRVALRAAGISSATITKELHAIEPAVRGEVWRLMFGPLSGSGRRK
jgi:Family of unknown function (DUF6074)